MDVLWGFKVFCSKLPKEVESIIRTSGNPSIQGRSRKRKGKSGSGERKGSGVGKSLVQCNKDGNCAGNESHLSVNASFGISQFSIQSAEIKEFSMESKHLVVKCLLKMEDKVIHTHPLIDCGATGIAFTDKDFLCHHQLKEQNLKKSRKLEVIDGRPIESGTITTMAILKLGIRGHQEQLPAFITKLGHYPILLELP
jgi:hypothetical protein